MTDIKPIIAKNLAHFRKQSGLTQAELAEKLNYSDKAVSRWEHGDTLPDINVLNQLCEFYGIDMNTLISSDTEELEKPQMDYKQTLKYRFGIYGLALATVWIVATVAFVYAGMISEGQYYWQIFVWAVPASCLILYPFNKVWGKYIWKFVILSVFVWTVLVGFYVQFIEYNIWLIFIIGVPVQAGLAIWAFLKPKE
jgi:transcriptional regulator with XRE-family HTH domain